jgi:hypothetical protein
MDDQRRINNMTPLLRVKKGGNPKQRKKTAFWQAFFLPICSVLLFFLLIEGVLTLLGVKPALQSGDPFVGFAENVPLFVEDTSPGGEHLMRTADNRLTFFNQQSFSAN